MIWASLLTVLPFCAFAWASGEITPALLDGMAMRGMGAGALAALYLGVFGTVVGYGLWVRALSIFDSSTISPFSLMIPVIGLAAGYLIFSETLTWVEGGGSLLIVAGVFVHVIGTMRTTPQKTALQRTAPEQR